MEPVFRKGKLYSSLIKTDFKTDFKWDKEVHFTLMKGKGHQDEIIIASIKQFILNFIKQILRIISIDGPSNNDGGRI
jgi:hypothetical protein